MLLVLRTSKVSITSKTILILCILVSVHESHVLDDAPLIDGHNDLPNNLYELLKNDLTNFKFDTDLSEDALWGSKNCGGCYTDLPRLKKGKVGAQFWVAYVSCSTQYKDALGKTLDQIDVIKRLINKYPQHLELVTTSKGIIDVFKKSKIGSLIGVEGGHSMDSRLGVLRMFYDLGVRYMTLTHSCNTPWADSSIVDDATPVHNLTSYGKLVVREMNRLGMMIDLSHVSHMVMNQAIQESEAPIMFSHSSAYAVKAHSRNVRDDTLLLVKANRGIVMVNFYSGFVSDKPNEATITDVMAHINHIVDVAGVEHVGIGGDYDGVSNMPQGLEDVSKYPALFDALRAKNSSRWTDDNLKLLAGGNLIRVFEDVEKVRDKLVLKQPYQQWIDNQDLDIDNGIVWRCRTLHNNTSPNGSSSLLKTNSTFTVLLLLSIKLIFMVVQ